MDLPASVLCVVHLKCKHPDVLYEILGKPFLYSDSLGDSSVTHLATFNVYMTCYYVLIEVKLWFYNCSDVLTNSNLCFI